jgi:hypothetical protein
MYSASSPAPSTSSPILLPDPLKSVLQSLGAAGGGVVAGLPDEVVWILLVGPLALRAWSDQIAHVFDTWRPREDGTPRRPPSAEPREQAPPAQAVELSRREDRAA